MDIHDMADMPTKNYGRAPLPSTFLPVIRLAGNIRGP
jgi:hypothetical protein